MPKGSPEQVARLTLAFLKAAEAPWRRAIGPCRLQRGCGIVVMKRGEPCRARFQKENPEEMIHLLLVVAVVLFVLWLLFHTAGALVNLIWLAIAVLVIIWLVGLFRGRSATS